MQSKSPRYAHYPGTIRGVDECPAFRESLHNELTPAEMSPVDGQMRVPGLHLWVRLVP